MMSGIYTPSTPRDLKDIKSGQQSFLIIQEGFIGSCVFKTGARLSSGADSHI